MFQKSIKVSSSIACFACSAMKQRLHRLDVATSIMGIFTPLSNFYSHLILSVVDPCQNSSIDVTRLSWWICLCGPSDTRITIKSYGWISTKFSRQNCLTFEGAPYHNADSGYRFVLITRSPRWGLLSLECPYTFRWHPTWQTKLIGKWPPSACETQVDVYSAIVPRSLSKYGQPDIASKSHTHGSGRKFQLFHLSLRHRRPFHLARQLLAALGTDAARVDARLVQ